MKRFFALFAAVVFTVMFSTVAAQTYEINGQTYRLENGQLIPVEGGDTNSADTLGSVNIAGRIVDDKGEGVSFATVALMDAEGRTAAIRVTDQRGRFDWKKVACGTYTLEASCVGYMTGRFEVKVATNSADIGQFTIAEGVVVDELVVKADRVLVKSEPDRIIYNVADDPDAAKLNTKKMMEKVPWIERDPQSNQLKVMGSDNFEILINGRRSLLTSQSDQYVLEVLKAKQVKAIEVITAPDGKYVDRKAVINLIVDDAAYLQGFAARLSVGGTTSPGATAGANITAKARKLIMQVNFNSRYEKPCYGGEIWTNSTYYNNPAMYSVESYEKRDNSTFAMFPIFSASYDFTDRDVVRVDGIYSQTHNRASSLLENRYSDQQGQTVLAYDTENNTEGRLRQLNMKAYYEHCFADNKQKTLTAQYTISTFPRINDYDTRVTAVEGIAPAGSRTRNSFGDREQIFGVVFFNPFRANQNYTLTAKYTLRDYSSDCLTFVNDGSQSLTDRLDYRLGIGSLAANYSIGGQKLKLTLQANVDCASYDATFLNVANPLKRTEWSSDQSAVLSFQASKMSNLRLKANSTIKRPGIFMLSPYVNTTNPGYIMKGNPELSPERVYDLSLSYTLMLYQKLTLSIDADYSLNNNAILSYSYIDADGAMVTTYDNIGRQDNFSTDLSLRYTFGGGMIRAGGYAGIAKAEYLGEQFKYFQYSLTLIGTINLWKGASTSILVYGNSMNNSVQAYKPHMDLMSSLSLDQNAGKWRFSLGLSQFTAKYRDRKTENRSSDFYYYQLNRTPGLQLSLSVAYTFGELKQYVKFIRNQIMSTDVK